MAGRNRLPRHALNGGPRGFPPGPGPIRDGPYRPGPLPHPARLEEELELQYEEIQRLLAENRRLAATHVDLRRELAGAQDELHRLNQIVGNVKVDKERQARDLVDKCMNLEAELRSVEPLRAEVMQLRADTQKLSASRQELSAQVQALNQDLTRAQADLQQVPALRAELDSLRQELIRSRTAIEYEKKANSEQFEQRQAMEKNLISMAREVEKLRAELTNSEKRAWATAGTPGGPYGTKLGTGSVGYSGPYAEAYGLHLSQGGVEKGSQYGSGSDPWGSFEKQRSHARR
jgi:septal ring factor EnvC (AmiA/AmiB activator)